MKKLVSTLSIVFVLCLISNVGFAQNKYFKAGKSIGNAFNKAKTSVKSGAEKTSSYYKNTVKPVARSTSQKAGDYARSAAPKVKSSVNSAAKSANTYYRTNAPKAKQASKSVFSGFLSTQKKKK